MLHARKNLKKLKVLLLQLIHYIAIYLKDQNHIVLIIRFYLKMMMIGLKETVRHFQVRPSMYLLSLCKQNHGYAIPVN